MACLVRGVLGGLLAIIKSTILFHGPSNAVMFRPPKNHDGKRPDGLTFFYISWQNGRCLTWDAPGITRDRTTIWNDCVNDLDKAKLLAIKAVHSSDWLFAHPIFSCGLRMCDVTIRVAVGSRLGRNLCEAHTYPCGSLMSARDIHGLSCKRSAGRSSRHHQVNDLIWWTLKRCDVPATKEPSGLLRDDGKRPDGLMLVPWQNGQCLT